MTGLHDLLAVKTKSKKRVGRGTGSGKGSHTVGRGGKGQTSRVGKPVPLWFEGGQLPMLKRLPFMRGKSKFKTIEGETQLVTLTLLAKVSGGVVNPESLKKAGVIHNAHHIVKITGTGEVKKAYTVSGVRTTQSAKAAIEKAGGTVA